MSNAPFNSLWATPPPDLGAPPPSMVQLPSDGPPNLPAATPPRVMAHTPSALETNLGQDEARLEKVRWAQDHPWGTPENHPGAMGKLAHVFSSIGNIAGNIVAPGVMANIPGTEMNREVEEGRLSRRTEGEQHELSEEGLQGAQKGHLEEETSEMPDKAESEKKLQGAQAANLESETRDRDMTAAQGPPLATAYAHAVQEALKKGVDPSTDPIVQHLSDAIVALQPGQNKPDGPAKTIQLEVGGKPHQMGWDAKTSKYDVDMGESGEKPPTVNVNAGMAALDREASRLAKPYEKGAADANTQLEKIADARSMINGSAEAQALGVPKVLTALVSGQGSGVRITMPELNAIAHARGLSGDIQGTLNSWAGQGKLTHTQQQQLTSILNDVQTRILQKQSIHNEALDAINGAGSREDAIRADKTARQKLNQLEQGGSGGPAVGTVENGYRFKGGNPADQASWEKVH